MGEGAIENKGLREGPLLSKACGKREESGRGSQACHESPLPASVFFLSPSLRFSTQKLPPKHTCCCFMPLRLPKLCLPRWPLPTAITVLPTKVFRCSSPSLSSSSHPTHTDTHLPSKPSHLASHHLLSLEHLDTSQVQTHILQTGSIKKTKPTTWGQGLGGLRGQGTDFIPREMASVHVQGLR